MEDRTAEYKKYIAEHIDEIRKASNEHNIPFFVAVATKDDDDGRYCIESDSLLPESFGYGVNPNDTRFADFNNILSKDFTTRPIIDKEDHINADAFQIPEDFGMSDLDDLDELDTDSQESSPFSEAYTIDDIDFVINDAAVTEIAKNICQKLSYKKDPFYTRILVAYLSFAIKYLIEFSAPEERTYAGLANLTDQFLEFFASGSEDAAFKKSFDIAKQLGPDATCFSAYDAFNFVNNLSSKLTTAKILKTLSIGVRNL